MAQQVSQRDLDIVGLVSQRDLDIVRLQESQEKGGGGGRMQSWRIRMDREKEEGT